MAKIHKKNALFRKQQSSDKSDNTFLISGPCFSKQPNFVKIHRKYTFLKNSSLVTKEMTRFIISGSWIPKTENGRNKSKNTKFCQKGPKSIKTATFFETSVK